MQENILTNSSQASMESLESKVEFYEFLGKHPARAKEVAKKQHIANSIPKQELANHYRRTAETIRTLDQHLKTRRSQPK